MSVCRPEPSASCGAQRWPESKSTSTTAVDKANERLAKQKIDQLPRGLTPHSLRRTFASVLCAIGEPPQNIMGQLGHTTPAMTLRFYAREMSRRGGELQRLKALVQGAELPPTATEAPQTTSIGVRETTEEPVNSGTTGP
jgi:integrase